MNKSAILHIPMSQYAYGTDEEHVTIRLRTAKDDIKRCRLYFGDRACRLTPVIFTEAEMHVVAGSELFDYYEVKLVRPYKRLCYYFRLESETEEIYYYGDCFSAKLVDDRSEYYQLPFNHRADIVRPPEWAKDAVIYNIFPDSFATGKTYISGKPTEAAFEGNVVRGKLGGCLKGITENVDYLKNLGVNAIYINPIFAAGEYHKYDLLDYFHIDPCFGTNDDFKELVDTFHANGIRVIIDGVFNHCGWHFPAFEDVVQKGEASDKKDWFYGLQFPVIRPEDPEEYPNYECFGYERMMPKLDTANPEVADFICKVGRYWVEEFHTDGWRLDVASEINDALWRRFYREVKEVNPEAILIGEVWETANHWLDGTIFDSTMNYDFRKHCKRFFGEESISSAAFDSRVTNMRMRYREQTVFAQLNLLDSHDVSRFYSLCNEHEWQYRLALIFQMTFPGMPSVFYGDELGITGIEEADYRQAMPWKQACKAKAIEEKELREKSFEQNSPDSLFTFMRSLIQLRRKEELLRRGDFRTVYTQEKGGLYIYERYSATERIRVMINRNEEPMDVAAFLAEPGSGQSEILLVHGLMGSKLDGYGYVIIKGRVEE